MMRSLQFINKKDAITKQSNHVDSALSNGPIRIWTGIDRLGGGCTIQLYYRTKLKNIIAFTTGFVKTVIILF